jgi:hypothetical protein
MSRDFNWADSHRRQAVEERDKIAANKSVTISRDFN